MSCFVFCWFVCFKENQYVHIIKVLEKKIFSLCPGNMQTSHTFSLEFNRKLLLVLYNFSLIKRKLRKFFKNCLCFFCVTYIRDKTKYVFTFKQCIFCLPSKMSINDCNGTFTRMSSAGAFQQCCVERRGAESVWVAR